MASQAIILPFSFNSSGALAYTEDPKKIWQDRVVTVVMTKLGEKVMRPTFGSKAGAIVFENLSDALVAIKQEVASAFAKWLPELALIKVVGKEDTSENLLVLEITYKYNEQALETVTIKTALINRSGEILLEVRNG